ncbi:hypothetical protein PIB30_047722 [Stylosanthes scabra]|uniref:Aminotransferase-like plant mobile domain-containing protein n=1 Tax=Stylosanthes scabra TaxID=79078 RepID=A0ABU6VHT5_9FABA|nr:hypothetical protein [Stylosanthes scabra]
MVGSGAGRDRGGAQIVRDPDINRLNGTHHVAGTLGFETPRKLTLRGVVPNLSPPDVLIPYIREVDFGGPLEMRSFDYDMSLLSAVVEKWRPETHSFHLAWGECTITL